MEKCSQAPAGRSFRFLSAFPRSPRLTEVTRPKISRPIPVGQLKIADDSLDPEPFIRRQLLPRFTFRIPACEDGLEALSNYHMVRTTSTGLAVDEPVHDWASHASSALKIIAEAEMAGMLSSAGSTTNVHRRPVTVKTGFRGNANDDSESSILDRFFGPPRRNVRVIR